MSSNEDMSKQQMIYITANFVLGSSLIILTGLEYAKKDIFICDILGLVLGILLSLMMTYVIDKFPNIEYTKILDKIFNPILGRILATVYLIYSICLLCLIETNITGLITTMVMPKTPSWIIAITITFIIAYVMNKGIHVFSLSVEILFPSVFVLMIFIYGISFIKLGNINNIYPVFTESMGKILKGTIGIFSFPYIDSCLLIFIYSLSKEKFKRYKVVKTAYLMVGLFLILRSEIIISVLGIDEALRFTFPLFELVRLIQIGKYIERLELILLTGWIISTYIKLGTCYYVSLKCIEYIFNLKDYRKISTALAILIVPIGINTMSDIQDIYIRSIVTIPSIKVPILVVTILVFMKTLMISMKKNKDMIIEKDSV